MIAQVQIGNQQYKFDLTKAIDISIPLKRDKPPVAFGAKPYSSEPFKSGGFVGALEAGSPVNFYEININPHGNGTHTESVLHIDQRGNSINDTLKQFHFLCQLISVEPDLLENGDRQIEANQIESLLPVDKNVSALVIRTRTNSESKLSQNYTGTNPCYFSKEAIELINRTPVQHLLLDMPSVDKEQDGGALIAHKTFWNIKSEISMNKTITEMIYVDDVIADGVYLLNLQIISLDIDASPSKPILYKVLDQ